MKFWGMTESHRLTRTDPPNPRLGGVSYGTMLDIVKALLALRLVAYLATFIVALTLVAIWTLARGSIAAGTAILAGVVISAAAIGLTVARRTTRRTR